ncbi:MAG: Dihydroorotase [Anaerolineae bacterium]|nr:MAG: Dihydroorotase [Anaerolineae bacterium]
MSVVRLPGLIDVHVHFREPGATHKEDWDSGTAAALAGGFTLVLAMPNTQPPITDETTLQEALRLASQKARCDFAHYVGAGPDNAEILPGLADRTAGLKMYLDQTYGPLRLDDMRIWMEHFEHWPKESPIVAHAEGRTLAAMILMAEIFERPVHLAHVSKAEEILLIRKAKEKGIAVTCEVCPHHLFLSKEDASFIGGGRSEVRPRLNSLEDQRCLWENLEIIDCFATDHAPHTLMEKDGQNPPPGFPGLETILPLLLTAVHQGKLTLDDIVKRLYTNPKKIFHLPDQADTWIEVDVDQDWVIQGRELYTRCGWTPFEGRRVKGRVQRVVLRGQTAYESGRVLTWPGFGQSIREIGLS